MGSRWNLFGFPRHWVFFVVLIFHINIKVCCSLNLEGLALLEVRARVDSDPYGALSDWNPNDDSPCMWSGVLCHNDEVHMLDLSELALGGILAPEIGNLSNMRALLAKHYLDGSEEKPLCFPRDSEPCETQGLEHLLTTRRKLLESASNLPAAPTSGAQPSSGSASSLSSGSMAAKIPSSLPSPSPPSPNSSPPNVSNTETESQGQTARSWVYIIMLAAVAIILLVCLVFLSMCQSHGAAAIGPWKTRLSGQLQKAFVTGAPKLNRAELETACEDFSNIIGTLPDCTIFKGTLSSGVEIAVTSTTVTSNEDWSKSSELYFRKKIDILSRLNHKNFVNLLGYCIEDEPFTRMMVFEYASNGTLFEHLHYKEVEHVDWSARMRIIMGMAYCLQYMHHEMSPPVAHPNLQSTSIYLMDDFAAKLADFTYRNGSGERTKPGDDDDVDRLNRLYADLDGNIYKFGILLLEIISGKLPYSEEQGFLINWAVDYLNDKRSISYMIDPTLKSFKNNELDAICEVIQQCIHPDTKQRPTMRDVATKLREVLGISPEAATPRLSPLWWAELEILSVEAS